MRSRSVHAPVLEHHDLVGVHDGGHALRNHDLGDVRELGEVLAYAGVCGHVARRGRVVEDQHAGVLEQRAGNAEALLLAAGDVAATVAQVCVKPANAV